MIKMKLHIKLAEFNMTKNELSKRTGVRTSTISSYCNGKFKHVVKEHLDFFCEVFDCPISDLIEYVPNKKD